jgi:anti-anti-sigma factor
MPTVTAGGPGLGLTARTGRGHVIAALSGELDIASAPALREQLPGLLQPAAGRLVINLSAVRYADASGLAVLVGTGRRARLLGGFVRLAAPAPAVASVLRLTGMHRQLDTFPAVQAAMTGRPMPAPAVRHHPHRQRAAVIPAVTRRAGRSDYRVACVNKKLSRSGDEHIVSVRISGEPDTITVQQAYRRMDARHHLYTVSPSTGAMVFVEKYRCCDMHTLRSVPDAVHDNNLDSLDPCT